MESAKELGKVIAQRILMFLLKKILVALAPYLGIIALVVIILLALYEMLFGEPREYAKNQGQMAFFTTGYDKNWTLDKDKQLQKEYQDLVQQGLGSKNQQLYTPSQYEQAQQYQLNWSVLAALDRVLGDPVMNDKVNFKPDPATRYELLKPFFTWQSYTVTAIKRVKDQNGNFQTETQRAPVSLLAKAETYDAIYVFYYRPEQIVINGVTVNHEVLDHVQKQTIPADQNRLVKILKDNHLTANDRYLIEELAATYIGDPRPSQGIPTSGEPLPSDEITQDIKLALQMRGLPADWLPGMQILIMHESTGNPHAYNPTPVWYSDKWGYQHAEGLCQMMPPTFDEYKLQGHDDIWNPLDNILASLAYIKADYGSVYNIDGISNGTYQNY